MAATQTAVSSPVRPRNTMIRGSGVLVGPVQEYRFS